MKILICEGVINKWKQGRNALQFFLRIGTVPVPNWKANKSKHGKGDNPHPIFYPKNNKRKISIHHEIIDCIAEQIVSMCKESKLWIQLNLRRPNFKFTNLCTVDIWTLKRNFVKGNKKPFKPIKQNFHNREALRTLHIQFEISSC